MLKTYKSKYSLCHPSPLEVTYTFQSDWVCNETQYEDARVSFVSYAEQHLGPVVSLRFYCVHITHWLYCMFLFYFIKLRKENVSLTNYL